MLGEAKSHAERLVVCLATDATIERLKGHAPLHVFDERAAALQLLPIVDEIVAGDDQEGSYAVIEKVNPTVIAFGYDQKDLREDCTAYLERRHLVIPTVVLQPHEPDKYKSSILNKRDA